MNKSELIEEVVHNTGISQKDVKTVLNDALETIVAEVADGVEVQLSGFGKFTRVERAARSGVNSFTKKPFKTPAHHAPKFTPAKDFKSTVR